MRLITPVFFLAIFIASCSQPSAEKADESSTAENAAEQIDKKIVKKKVANVILEPRSESNTSGKVQFIEEDGKIRMMAKIMNASQGIHAIHIHAEGDCSATDGTSAGGHWNPTNEDHGKWGVKPFHRGDIGNMEADKNGSAILTMATELWCLGCDDETKNILGKSIIVHAGEDDCKSQPSGAAGARIACGVINMQ